MRICFQRMVCLSPRHTGTYFVVHHHILWYKGMWRPPGNIHKSLRTLPHKATQTSILWLFLMFVVSTQIWPDQSSSSLTTQAILVAFLYLLVSITSLSFISFISYSYHHSLQFSCLFIHLRIVCTPPIQNEAPWGRDPALLTGQKEGYSQHQNRTHWI